MKLGTKMVSDYGIERLAHRHVNVYTLYIYLVLNVHSMCSVIM